jgi:hypothetical protein
MPGEEALYATFQSIIDAAAKDPKIKQTLTQTAIASEKRSQADAGLLRLYRRLIEWLVSHLLFVPCVSQNLSWQDRPMHSSKNGYAPSKISPDKRAPGQ